MVGKPDLCAHMKGVQPYRGGGLWGCPLMCTCQPSSAHPRPSLCNKLQYVQNEDPGAARERGFPDDAPRDRGYDRDRERDRGYDRDRGRDDGGYSRGRSRSRTPPRRGSPPARGRSHSRSRSRSPRR